MSTARIAKLAGLLLGAGIMLVAAIGWSITQPREAASPAALELTASPSGELAVSPAGAFLRSSDLRPGKPAARGALHVRNQTAVALDVTIRAQGQTSDLDELALVRVRGVHGVLFDGPLGKLSTGMTALTLAPGTAERLQFAARLPASAGLLAQGRSDAIALRFDSVPHGASS